MPTDQSHVIAFLVALSGIASLGVGVFVYIWRTTPSRKPEQRSFDFESSPEKPAAAKIKKMRPMARA